MSGMDRPRMRPTFVLPHADPSAVLGALPPLLEAHPRLTGTLFRRHAVLGVREEARHFWSPQLHLEVRLPDADDEDAPPAPQLHGRFSPHPHVWTMFMALYGVLGALGLAGLIAGLSQWTLGDAPWALIAIPVALALGGFVYGATFIGQGLGAEEMYALRSLLDRAIERADQPSERSARTASSAAASRSAQSPRMTT